jgi:hypothetical protein
LWNPQKLSQRRAQRDVGGASLRRRPHRGHAPESIVVNTPNAAFAVRGTHFWAGPIEGKYGVLLLKGKVRVSGR